MAHSLRPTCNAKILSLSILLFELIGLPAEALAKAGGGGGSRTRVRKYST